MNSAKQPTNAESEDAGRGTGSRAIGAQQSGIPVIVRLQEMQRQARRLLLLNGLATLILGGTGALLMLILLDWAFWFPSAIRMLFALAWLALSAGIISRFIWPALISQFSTLHVAAKIEERFPQFQDRLTSAVSFISEEYAVQDSLQGKLIERTEEIARKVPIEQVLTHTFVRRRTLLALGAVTTFFVIALVNPPWLSMGINRYMLPFLPTYWPKTVHIHPLTENLTIVSGESVVVSMEILAGHSETLRAHVYLSRGGRAPERAVMRREGRQSLSGAPRFAWTINTITEDLGYWFEAGDDSTRHRRSSIRVVSRPKVVDLRATIVPPAYVIDADPQLVAVGQRAIDVIEGSAIDFTFRSSKPLGRDSGGGVQAWIAADNGARVPATPEPDDPGTLTAKLAPAEEGEYHIHIFDRDGFENQGADPITVAVHRDAPPHVSIFRPVGVLEVTPRATVRIVASAGDDLGVSRIALSGTVAPAGRPFERPVPITQPTDPAQSRRSTRVDLLWSLVDLELKVGDRVQYTLMAWDNRSSERLQPQAGRGHTLQLDVVSADQLAEGAADELKLLADRLRRYLRLQERLLGDTLNHLQTLQDSPAFDPDAQLLRLSARQRRLADKIAAMRKSVAALADDLARNRIDQTAEKRQAELFADQLRHEVERYMHQAAGQLTDARSQTERTEQVSVVEQASTSERAAARAMRTLLDQLTVWNDYQSVLSNLRELTDQQQEITRQTAAAQETTLGQESARLTPEARDELNQVAQAQDHTTMAIKRAIKELANLGKKLRSKQADDARALSDARKQLQTQKASENSQAAAQAIRQNHTARAQTAQRDVERALAEAVSRLEQREQRRLAELSRKLADSIELVKRLLAQQQEIQTATRATPPAQVPQQLPQLAGRQRNLRKATLAVVDKLAELTETGEIAEYLREAARIMSRATDALYELRSAVALDQHSGAIDYLQRAIEQLEQIREQKEQAMKQAKLFALKRELLKTRRQQASINSATAKIIERIEQFGRLTRINVRRAKKQAKAQEELLGALNKLQEELSETPVYLWVVGQIAQAMGTSAQMLTQAPMDHSLPRAQRRALALLDRLIDAIRQTEAMIEEQFAEGGGGASGGGQAEKKKQRAVPTVAELIVLKAMQQDIVSRTMELSEYMDADQPTEQHLSEASMLGREEQELMQITQELTQKARAHP